MAFVVPSFFVGMAIGSAIREGRLYVFGHRQATLLGSLLAMSPVEQGAIGTLHRSGLSLGEAAVLLWQDDETGKLKGGLNLFWTGRIFIAMLADLVIAGHVKLAYGRRKQWGVKSRQVLFKVVNSDSTGSKAHDQLLSYLDMRFKDGLVFIIGLLRDLVANQEPYLLFLLDQLVEKDILMKSAKGKWKWNFLSAKQLYFPTVNARPEQEVAADMHDALLGKTKLSLFLTMILKMNYCGTVGWIDAVTGDEQKALKETLSTLRKNPCALLMSGPDGQLMVLPTKTKEADFLVREESPFLMSGADLEDAFDKADIIGFTKQDESQEGVEEYLLHEEEIEKQALLVHETHAVRK